MSDNIGEAEQASAACDGAEDSKHLAHEHGDNTVGDSAEKHHDSTQPGDDETINHAGTDGSGDASMNPVQPDAINKPDKPAVSPDQCDNIENPGTDGPGKSSVNPDHDDTTKKDLDETSGSVPNMDNPDTDGPGNSSQSDTTKKDVVDGTSGTVPNQPGNDGTANGRNDQEQQAPPEDKIEPGLLPGPEDDVGDLKVVKDTTTFLMSEGSSTKWFSALVAFDGKLLPGFAPGAVKQIGLGKHQGLRVEVQLAMGEYTEPGMMLRFKTRHRNTFDTFTYINIPLGALLDAPEVDDLDTRVHKGLGELLSFKPFNFGRMKPGTGFSSGALVDALEAPVAESDPTIDPTQPATEIFKVSDHARRLRVSVDVEGMMVNHLSSFDKKKRKLEGIADIANETFWLPKLRDYTSYLAPYNALLGKVRDNHTDLTYGNYVNPEPDARPEKPVSAATFFTSGAQRSASLIGSAVEEQAMLDARAVTLADMEMQIMVIRDPFSDWIASPKDMDDYGIVADGQPRHWYFAINLADNEGAPYLPEIGSKCKFHLPGAVKESRPLPTTELHHDQTAEIARDLFRQLTAARDDAKGVARLLRDEAEESRRRGETDLASRQERQAAESYESHYQMSAGKALFSLVRVPSKEAVELYPNHPVDFQRVKTAYMLAERLRRLPNEGEYDFSERLAVWVEENDVEPIKETESEHGEAWNARRIPLPPGTRAPLALFSVHTPTQTDWPTALTRPPIICQLPAHDVVGPLPKYLRSISTLVDADTGAMRTPTTKIKGYIHYEVDDKTLRIESNAVTDMNTVSQKYTASKFWTHALDFRAEVPRMNWLDSFPQIRQDIQDGFFQGEHKAAAESLENAPGYMFISGGPGSGKSTFATRLARSVMASDVESRRILWIAPQNKMVEDAMSRHKVLSPEKRIGRMFPWKAEMSALMGKAKTPFTVDYMNQKGTKQDRRLAEHVNMVLTQAFQEKSPTHDPSSMSNIARQVAAANEDEWEPYRAMVADLDKNDTNSLKTNLVKNRETCRKLLVAAAESCDAICATPVAAAELADHSEIEFACIVVDEAGRMTENAMWIPVVKHPRTPCMYLDDTKQFGPMALARDDKAFKDIFGPQRALSLFRRSDSAGQHWITFKVNNRAQGTVVDWAANYFYDGEMDVANAEDTTLTDDFVKWAAQQFGTEAKSAIYLIDIEGSSEIKIGTSFANPVNALFGREFIGHLYRSAKIKNGLDVLRRQTPVRFGTVLVIVAYAAQKNEWQALVADMSPAEVPKDLVDVRTIDESPSMEADIVIADLGRTTAEGFLSSPQRIAVMATRARYGFFVLGNKGALRRESHLGSLLAYLDRRNAAISIAPPRKMPGWTAFCNRCVQHGHSFADCRTVLKCSICMRANMRRIDHATRHCPLAKTRPFPQNWTDTMPNDDGVDRNPLLFELPGSGKRRKGRREDRHNASAAKKSKLSERGHDIAKSSAPVSGIFESFTRDLQQVEDKNAPKAAYHPPKSEPASDTFDSTAKASTAPKDSEFFSTTKDSGFFTSTETVEDKLIWSNNTGHIDLSTLGQASKQGEGSKGNDEWGTGASNDADAKGDLGDGGWGTETGNDDMQGDQGGGGWGDSEEQSQDKGKGKATEWNPNESGW